MSNIFFLNDARNHDGKNTGIDKTSHTQNTPIFGHGNSTLKYTWGRCFFMIVQPAIGLFTTYEKIYDNLASLMPL
jgi:hypothetical protein